MFVESAESLGHNDCRSIIEAVQMSRWYCVLGRGSCSIFACVDRRRKGRRARRLEEMLEVFGEVASGRVPFHCAFCHRLQTNPFEVLRDRVVDLARRARFGRGDSVQ